MLTLKDTTTEDCVEFQPYKNQIPNCDDKLIKFSSHGRYFCIYPNYSIHDSKTKKYIYEFYQIKDDSKEKKCNFLFSKESSNYHPSPFIYFFTHPFTKQTVFVFNERFNILKVYNMMNDLLLTKEMEGHFMTSIETINDKYMILQTWAWHPECYRNLCSIERFLTEENYMGVKFTCKWHIDNPTSNLVENLNLSMLHNSKFCKYITTVDPNEASDDEICYQISNTYFLSMPIYTKEKISYGFELYDIEYFEQHFEEIKKELISKFIELNM